MLLAYLKVFLFSLDGVLTATIMQLRCFLSIGEFYHITLTFYCFEDILQNSIIEYSQLPGTTVLYSYTLRVRTLVPIAVHVHWR